MSKARLTLVPPEPPAYAEMPAERIRRLQQEARSLGRAQIEGLHAAMVSLASLAGEVAEGGDAYPVGARELTRRLVDELGQKAQILQAILRKA